MNEQNEDKLKIKKCSNPKCQKVIKYKHKSMPKICPECGDIYWEKPSDEYPLFILQEDFLKTKSQKTLGEMYLILKKYAKKLIVNMVKNKYYFKKDELEMKAHDSANKLIVYYLTKENFRIDTSFGGYMKWPVRNVLYGDKKNDNFDSLNVMIDEENSLEEYLPNLSSQAREKMCSEFDDSKLNSKEFLILDLYKLIYKIKTTIRKDYPKRDLFCFLIGLKNKIKQMNDTFMKTYYSYFNSNSEKNVNNALFFIYKKIKTYN